MTCVDTLSTENTTSEFTIGEAVCLQATTHLSFKFFAVQIKVISTYVTFVFPDLFTVTVTFSTEHELKQMSKWMEDSSILSLQPGGFALCCAWKELRWAKPTTEPHRLQTPVHQALFRWVYTCAVCGNNFCCSTSSQSHIAFKNQYNEIVQVGLPCAVRGKNYAGPSQLQSHIACRHRYIELCSGGSIYVRCVERISAVQLPRKATSPSNTGTTRLFRSVSSNHPNIL